MQTIQEVSEIQNINNWFIIDMGYSNNSKSCGVLKVRNNQDIVKDMSFSNLEDEFRNFYKECQSEKIGLMLEAPLSIAFDKTMNPCGRKFEIEFGEEYTKKGKKKIIATRYWYYGAGATVTLGALEFINRIKEILVCRNIYLFEGFVSFKENENKEKNKDNHYEDAKLLYKGVKADDLYEDNIIPKNGEKYMFIGDYLSLKLNGIPPIVKISKENKKEIFMIKS